MILALSAALAAPPIVDLPRSLQAYQLWAAADGGAAFGPGGTAFSGGVSHAAYGSATGRLDVHGSWWGVEQGTVGAPLRAYESLDLVVASAEGAHLGGALLLDVQDGPAALAGLLGRARIGGARRDLELRLGPAVAADDTGAAFGGRLMADGAYVLSPRVSLGGSFRADAWARSEPGFDGRLVAELEVWPTLRVESALRLGGEWSTGGGASGWAELAPTWWPLDGFGVRVRAGIAGNAGEAPSGWTLLGVVYRGRQATERAPSFQRRAFRVHAPEAQEVSVVGTFTGWAPWPLTRADGGDWVGEFALPAGSTEYAYLVDGRAVPPEDADRLVDDGFGGQNGVGSPDR